ncbi:hypothetical protein BKA62DRAFT_78564 [Auriculariales sp. MPI-PUGE-AT-0066]|nr:hypothetical protein BKA62DRAFT_78564 [Auriculariales sp. MPI-PUGE-AT-0066]
MDVSSERNAAPVATKMIVFQHENRRLLADCPPTYEEALALAQSLFAAGQRSWDVTLSLDICSLDPTSMLGVVEISSTAWNLVCSASATPLIIVDLQPTTRPASSNPSRVAIVEPPVQSTSFPAVTGRTAPVPTSPSTIPTPSTSNRSLKTSILVSAASPSPISAGSNSRNHVVNPPVFPSFGPIIWNATCNLCNLPFSVLRRPVRWRDRPYHQQCAEKLVSEH